VEYLSEGHKIMNEEEAKEDLRNGHISNGELEILAAYLAKLREE